MADHWAIIIGINQYHFLQPLMQAQNDALGLWRFLVEEAGFVPQQCILLSDLSVSTEHQAVYPDHKSVETWIQTVCQEKLADDDVLWVFFSGYGAQEEGEDYLMPVDGDPAQVSKTGIKISHVIETLKQAPTDNVVVVLDINRSQSALAGQSIGAQAVELSKMAGIPLLLSCGPDQFSHETLAVRHGLFTAALLEGLRYQGCLTLGHLDDYISDRVPELCEHHWRPIQNPVAVLTDTQKFEILLPQAAIEGLSMAEALDTTPPDRNDNLPPLEISAPIEMDDPLDLDTVPEADLETEMSLSDMEIEEEDWPLDIGDNESDSADITATIELPDKQTPSNKSGQKLGVWGVLGVFVLLAGVLLRNQPFFKDAFANLPDWLDWPSAQTGTDSDTRDADIGNDPANAPADTSNGENPTEEGSEGENTAADTTNEDNPDGAPPADGASSNADLLEAARRSVLPDQASQFANAIATASQIKPSDPLYEEAQSDIQRWRQGILDLARERAEDGDLDAALAAVQLMPDGPSAQAQSAQELVNTLELRQQGRELIREAQTIPKMGQASTYQRGILALQKVFQAVPNDQPEYEMAQQLIDEWSQKMLSIAQARAAQGKNVEAVAAANLIPEETAAYEQAQSDISRWQGQ